MMPEPTTCASVIVSPPGSREFERVDRPLTVVEQFAEPGDDLGPDRQLVEVRLGQQTVDASGFAGAVFLWQVDDC